MAQIPKGRLVKGPYKPICRDCAMYFSITVDMWGSSRFQRHCPNVNCSKSQLIQIKRARTRELGEALSTQAVPELLIDQFGT